METLYLLDGDGRIRGTRELKPSPGPVFSLIRGTANCAWAVRADVSRDLAEKLDGFAREEPAVSDFRVAPVHVGRYMSLVEGKVDSGPSFVFPEAIAESQGTVRIDDVALLDHHFSGWRASEIPECAPIVGVVEDRHAVSVCFSARRSDVAAEAGVETAVEFRGRGLGPRVTGCVGPGRASLWPDSAVQHVLVERGLVGGCAQVGAGGVCEYVECCLESGQSRLALPQWSNRRS